MFETFYVLQKLLIVADESNKAITVASTEENSVKNRCADAIPYDRNRVCTSSIRKYRHSLYKLNLLQFLYTGDFNTHTIEG